MEVHADAPPVELTGRQTEIWEKLRDGRWYLGTSLSNGLVGGSEGLRRLRELRAMGFTIVKKWAPKITDRWKDRRQYAYRLTGFEAGGR